MGLEMAEIYRGVMSKINGNAPNGTRVIAFIILSALLLLAAGLAVAGTVVVLLILTPLLLLFSPILIPVGTVLFVVFACLLSAGVFGVAGYSVVLWAYNYVKGGRPPGSDQIDYARMRIVDTAGHVKEYARECGGYLQSKVRDAAPGA